MSSEPVKLTVLVLVYNEVKTILQAIKDIDLIDVPNKEVIVVDNCSTDGTKDLLRNLADKKIKIIFNKVNLGAAKSIEIGLNAAKGEYVYVHHADLEYDARAALKMLALAENEKYDLVLGSRLKNKNISKWSIIKQRPEYLATIIATWLINYWYGKNFTDIIGARLYRAVSIRKISVNTYGGGFEFENISRQCRRGYKIGEIAVDYQPRSWKEGKKIKIYHMVNALFALFKVKIFG